MSARIVGAARRAPTIAPPRVSRTPAPCTAPSTSAPPTRPSPCPTRRRRHAPGRARARPARRCPRPSSTSSTGPEHDGPPRAFGRAAVAAYVDGLDGRLMRSMKSILGSSLVDQTTDVGGGRGVKYLDIVAGYLRHLKRCAEAEAGAPIDARGARPAGVLRRRRSGARRAGAGGAGVGGAPGRLSPTSHFQYEPIAAAFDYERSVDARAGRAGGRHRRRHLGLLDRARRPAARRAGSSARTTSSPTTACTSPAPTSTAASSSPRILPRVRLRRLRPGVAGAPPREVPSGVYFDLATWHLINTVYNPARVAELRSMRGYYAEPRHHARLMTVVDRAPRPRARGARRGRQDRRGRRRQHAHRPVARREPASPSSSARRRRCRRSTPTSSASSPRRARRRAQAGLKRRRHRRALLHRRLDRPAPARRSASPRPSRRRVPCAATASPAWPPAWACSRSAGTGEARRSRPPGRTGWWPRGRAPRCPSR